MCWKSVTLRVTTAIPCTNAVAAMSASRSPRFNAYTRRLKRDVGTTRHSQCIGNIAPLLGDALVVFNA